MSVFGYTLNIIAISVGFTLAILAQNWTAAMWIVATAIWIARAYLAEKSK